MKRRVIYLIDLLIIIVLTVLDLFTKHVAEVSLKGQAPFVIIDGVFEFNYLENAGSAFGIMRGKTVLILLISAVIMAAMIYFAIKIPEGKKYLPLHICVSMIMAGGIGNIYDRLKYGIVRDFIYFKLIDYPVFNVADMYVVVGIILLVILLLFVYKEEDLTFRSDSE